MTPKVWAGTSPAPTVIGKCSGEVYPRLRQVVFWILAFGFGSAFGLWHSELVCDSDLEILKPASFDSVRWPTVQLKQRAVMLTEYIEAAMRKAKYEILSDDNSFYGYIPDFDGVYANAEDLETCRTELKEVLEEWIMLGISRHLPLPIVDGIRLVVEEAV